MKDKQYRLALSSDETQPTTGRTPAKIMKRSQVKPNRAVRSYASPSIGFRLDQESRQALAQGAAALDLSPHELARRYVLLMLQEKEDRELLSEAIAPLRTELATLRRSFLLAVRALLHGAGKVSKDDALAWVQENLK